ncbi:MAG: hypothetical protein V4722_11250 [Bacteroidota bacterium]
MILVLIDGTGVFDDATYRSDFQNGFLKRLERNFTGHGEVRYWRGPITFDIDSAGIRDEVVAFLMSGRGTGPAHQVVIAGYSRGAAIAISVANFLHHQNLYPPAFDVNGSFDIPLLLLFDAVNRSSTLEETEYIPPTVQKCFHAKRDPRVTSRWYFGNCASNPADSIDYRERHFFCTHAGMGGCPWTGDHPERSVVDPSSVHTPRGRGDSGFTYLPHLAPIITEEEDTHNSEKIALWMNQQIATTSLAAHNLILDIAAIR